MSGKCHNGVIVFPLYTYYHIIMRYQYFNPNPKRADALDCVVRAICKVTERDWRNSYINICMEGLSAYDMPSSNHVWGGFLRKEGFRRMGLPDSCPDCYKVREFAADHPRGTYVLATGAHVVALVDGTYYDTWDSGDKVIDFYWYKEA